jgi:Amt family ammonium transporter
MTFACITAALVLGGVAERVKFSTVVVFAILWPVVVYYPMAHMVWWWGGPIMASDPANAEALAAGAGLIWSFGALDFAGGTVVHINSGVAALVGALLLGSRTGYRKEPMPPHNLTFTVIGAGLLWVGWVGFNAGSNLEATPTRARAHQHVRRSGRRCALLDAHRMAHEGQTQPARPGSGAVAGLVADHAGCRFRWPGGRAHPRPRCGSDLLVRLLGAEDPGSSTMTASMSSASTALAASSAPSAPASSSTRPSAARASSTTQPAARRLSGHRSASDRAS